MSRRTRRPNSKRSIFISPETHTPCAKQMHVIAETLAVFMNAEGGMLYIGVSDGGQISGMEDDLTILATQPSSVAVHIVRHGDTNFTYGATADKYELKIRSIVRAFLSPNANALVGQIETKQVNGKSVCRVVCKPCAPDEFVYSYRKYVPNKPEVAEIFQRIGNQKKNLQGVERDEFVRKRVMAGFDKQALDDPRYRRGGGRRKAARRFGAGDVRTGASRVFRRPEAGRRSELTCRSSCSFRSNAE